MGLQNLKKINKIKRSKQTNILSKGSLVFLADKLSVFSATRQKAMLTVYEDVFFAVL